MSQVLPLFLAFAICFILIPTLTAENVRDTVVSSSILTRLAKVEGIVQSLQDENRKLQLENKELKNRLDKVEINCRAQTFQIFVVKRKLQKIQTEALSKAKVNQTQKQESYGAQGKASNNIDGFNPQLLPEPTDTERYRGRNTQRRIARRKGNESEAESRRLLLQIPTQPTVEPRTSKHVAFTAYLSHDIHNQGLQQILKFDQLLLNDGNSYNPHTGIFTVPVSGVYILHFHIVEITTVHPVVAKLVVDGINQVDTVAYPSDNGHDSAASNTAILRLKQGQTVWVAFYLIDNAGVHSGTDVRFTTFSGALLYQ